MLKERQGLQTLLVVAGVLALFGAGVLGFHLPAHPKYLPQGKPLAVSAVASAIRTAQPRVAPSTATQSKAAPKHKHTIYITIDDGPWPEFVVKVLPVLKAHNCRATFFVVGGCLAHDAQAAPQLSRAGHEVEIHTWTHPQLTRLSAQRIRSEVQRTADVVLKQTGQHPQFVRPPYGSHSKRTDTVIRQMGYRVALWDVSCGDFDLKDPETIVTSIAEQARPGAIVLLHEVPQTAKALPELLARLDTAGYQYGLLRDRPTPAQATARATPPGGNKKKVSGKPHVAS